MGLDWSWRRIIGKSSLRFSSEIYLSLFLFETTTKKRRIRVLTERRGDWIDRLYPGISKMMTVCRLCLVESPDVIHIFRELGVQLKVSSILSKHFGSLFEVRFIIGNSIGWGESDVLLSGRARAGSSSKHTTHRVVRLDLYFYRHLLAVTNNTTFILYSIEFRAYSY